MKTVRGDIPLAMLVGIESYDDGSIVLHFRLADGSALTECFARTRRGAAVIENDLFHGAVLQALKSEGHVP